MIEKLTQEQEDQKDVYVKKWTDIGLSTEPINEERATAAIHEVYEKSGNTPPKEIVFVKSPHEAYQLLSYLQEHNPDTAFGHDFSKQKIKTISNINYGSHDAWFLSFYDFFREVVGLKEQTEEITGLIAISKEAGWFISMVDVCIVSERHNTLNLDEEGRLHSLEEIACGYPDGFGVWAVHGIRVPSWIITDPQDITVDKIDNERNVEIRRVMMGRYGESRYMQDSNATEIHRDDYGILYHKPQEDDEDIFMVRAINSSPEPNGEYKVYFLRVPPETKTAKAGLAWMSYQTEETYNPSVET